MIEVINDFFASIHENPIELYNESGFQHELAIFLRENYPNLKIRLEYPTSKIFHPLPNFLKKEIDIYITTQTGERYVIELKMPRLDCGVPNEMYRAVQDIKFLEQLIDNGIDGCYAVLITNRQAFWHANPGNLGIYQLFNGQQVNIHSIELDDLQPFLQTRGPLHINNVYHSDWVNYFDINNTNWKYYLLEIF